MREAMDDLFELEGAIKAEKKSSAMGTLQLIAGNDGHHDQRAFRLKSDY
jgi:hypothetical protein